MMTMFQALPVRFLPTSPLAPSGKSMIAERSNGKVKQATPAYAILKRTVRPAGTTASAPS
jgi:hypothetical protein